MRCLQCADAVAYAVVAVTVPQPAADLWRQQCAVEAVRVHREWWPARAGDYGPFREMLDYGTLCAPRAAAIAAERAAYAASVERAVLARCDVVLCPTLPCTGFTMDSSGEAVPPHARWDRGRYTKLWNLCSLAAVTLPCGRVDAAGRPVSVQLVGRDVDVLLRVAMDIERRFYDANDRDDFFE